MSCHQLVSLSPILKVQTAGIPAPVLLVLVLDTLHALVQGQVESNSSLSEGSDFSQRITYIGNIYMLIASTRHLYIQWYGPPFPSS